MQIKINFSFLPESLISLILNSDELKKYSINNNSINYLEEQEKIVVFDIPLSIEIIKEILNSILEKNSIYGYIIAQDTEVENSLVILKAGDLQQLGIFICDFCGALSNSEEEKYIHQRAHYFF